MSTRSSAREVWVGLIVIVGRGRPDRPGRHGERRSRLPGAAADHRRRLSRRPGHPHRQPGAGRRPRHRQRRRRRPGRSRGHAPCAGADLAAGQPGQEAAPGREGLDPARAHRHEPRQHRSRRADRAVALVPGQSIPGRRDVVLRPDHRAGRAGPGRAEPPEPHDRRGARRRSIRSGPGSGRCSARFRRRRPTCAR